MLGGGCCWVWIVDDDDEGWSFVLAVDGGWVGVWIGSKTIIAIVCSDSVTCTDSGTTVSTTGFGIAFCGEFCVWGCVVVGVEMEVYLGDVWWVCYGCWLTNSIYLGTDLVAFCGVLVISAPKCLSKENRFEGESHWGRSEVGGSSGSSVLSAAAKDCSTWMGSWGVVCWDCGEGLWSFLILWPIGISSRSESFEGDIGI